jgi:hypothetical protein
MTCAAPLFPGARSNRSAQHSPSTACAVGRHEREGDQAGRVDDDTLSGVTVPGGGDVQWRSDAGIARV